MKVARKLGRDNGYMDLHDTVCQSNHDEAEAERVFRVVRKWATELAVSYANAVFLHSCRLWKSTEVAQELEAAHYQYRQIEQVEEQMMIITQGGGLVEMEFRKKHPQGEEGRGDRQRCSFCGTKYGVSTKEVLVHRIAHLMEALEEIEEDSD